MSRSFERYNAFRVTVAVLALGSSLWSIAGETELTQVVRTIGFALLVLLIGLLAMRGRAVSRGFELFQLLLDVVLVSVLSEVTGALHSFFTLLYFPIIGAGAYLQRRSGALWAAAFASVGFAFMLAARAGFVPPVADELGRTWAEAMFRIFAFFLTALLVGQLGEQLASAGRQLQKERVSTFQLATEHDTVLDRVRAAVLSADDAGVITAVNPFGRALLGDVLGKGLSEVFSAQSDTWEEQRPGAGRWVCSRAPLPDGGSVVVVEDVTELEQMRQTAANAERLVAAGTMAAGMAHEIRNPLASMSGALQLLREERPSSIVDLALTEADRLNRLVEDFLDLTRRPALRRETIDIGALCADVCQAFSLDPRFSGRVVTHFSGTAPWTPVDPDRIRQAMWNLLLNGAQAMPRGGRVDVTVRDLPAENATEITVADGGPGIPDRERSRVFDPFYTTRTGGTGLGLLLVDQIVRGHGGRVEIRSRTGQAGTEMCVWLPREADVAS